jgi:DNA repair ATPase RecN
MTREFQAFQAKLQAARHELAAYREQFQKCEAELQSLEKRIAQRAELRAKWEGVYGQYLKAWNLMLAKEGDLNQVEEKVMWLRRHLGQNVVPSNAVTFRAIALILPRRLYIEDLGDAIEEIALLEQARAPRWQIWLKIGSTYSWLFLNALREIVSVIKGLARSK